MRGFTLIDIIMVISIIGIVALLSIPQFDVFYEMKLQSAAKKLISDIRYTQTVAITTKQDYAIDFDVVQNVYRAYRVSDNSTLLDPFTHAPLEIDFKTHSQYRGVDIQNVDIGGGTTLRFNWQGTPQTGTGSDLTTQGNITLEYKNSEILIKITPYTGKIEVE